MMNQKWHTKSWREEKRQLKNLCIFSSYEFLSSIDLTYQWCIVGYFRLWTIHRYQRTNWCMQSFKAFHISDMCQLGPFNSGTRIWLFLINFPLAYWRGVLCQGKSSWRRRGYRALNSGMKIEKFHQLLLYTQLELAEHKSSHSNSPKSRSILIKLCELCMTWKTSKVCLNNKALGFSIKSKLHIW